MFENTLNKVRLFFRKDQEPYLNFYKILGFYPRDISLYMTALRHKSYQEEFKGSRAQGSKGQGHDTNNERLEFLGDAVLGAVVADVLYHKYPDQQEGYLSTLRSKLVKRESLNRLAVQIGLDKLVLHSDRISTTRTCLNGNAFEAFIGAIYLDQGYERCKQFISQRILTQNVDVEQVANKEENFKSRLIEWCQKYQLAFDFKVVDENKEKGDNAIKFVTVVTIEGIKCGKGSGFSKKESHQQAAKSAMQKLRGDVGFVNSLFEKRNKK